MAGGTSRSSFAIEISILNHPAFGVSPFMDTRIQVQIIAQEPAEVESCTLAVSGLLLWPKLGFHHRSPSRPD